MGGLRTAWRAAAWTGRNPGWWPVALAGFLARGGIVLFVVPIVAGPSLVGLATFIGPASITPGGPTPALLVRLAVGLSLAVAALLGGTIVAAAAEIVLVRAGRNDRDVRWPERGLLGRVVVIRLVCLLPVVLVLGVVLPRLGEIAYLELTLPTDLASPIALRVAARAPEVVGAILVAWLLGETWAGLAVRLAILQPAGLARDLLGGLILPVRRIGLVGPVLVVSVVVAGAVLGLTVELVSWSWGYARDALLGGTGTGALPAAAATTLLFAACWAAGLTGAAVLATWRSLTWTVVTGQDHRGSGGTGSERGNL